MRNCFRHFRQSLFSALLLAFVTAEAGYAAVVVTDIDDTIKQTHVSNPFMLFGNGLLGKTAFAGMPELFMAWLGVPQSEMVYLSAGPKFTSGRLERFFRLHEFPRGKLMTRNPFREKKAEFKYSRLVQLAVSGSDSFILVGDDTEHDPEVYTRFRAENPDRVLAIYIHRVSGRELPSDVHPFYTALDIAAWEHEAQRISADDYYGIAAAILNPAPRTVRLPSYGICPNTIPGEQPPRMQDPELGILQLWVETAALNACSG